MSSIYQLQTQFITISVALTFELGNKSHKYLKQSAEQRATKCKEIAGSGIPRDSDSKQYETFQAVADYLDINDDDQVTISDLKIR